MGRESIEEEWTRLECEDKAREALEDQRRLAEQAGPYPSDAEVFPYEPPPGMASAHVYGGNGDLSFGAKGFTTVRACVDCDVLIRGGPSRCTVCVRAMDNKQAEADPWALPDGWRWGYDARGIGAYHNDGISFIPSHGGGILMSTVNDASAVRDLVRRRNAEDPPPAKPEPECTCGTRLTPAHGPGCPLFVAPPEFAAAPKPETMEEKWTRLECEDKAREQAEERARKSEEDRSQSPPGLYVIQNDDGSYDVCVAPEDSWAPDGERRESRWWGRKPALAAAWAHRDRIRAEGEEAGRRSRDAEVTDLADRAAKAIAEAAIARAERDEAQDEITRLSGLLENERRAHKRTQDTLANLRMALRVERAR